MAMPESDHHLPVPEELAAALRRVVGGQKAETIYDAAGAPVAVLIPVAEPGVLSERERFVQQLRAWRTGDPEEQRREWDQLAEVLAEERGLEAAG
jgi:hypothetical protein